MISPRNLRFIHYHCHGLLDAYALTLLPGPDANQSSSQLGAISDFGPNVPGTLQDGRVPQTSRSNEPSKLISGIFG